MDFAGTIPHTPPTTLPDPEVHRRVSRMLVRLRCVLPTVALRQHEARLLVDMACWQAAVCRREEFDLSASSVLEYLGWLFRDHLRYVHTNRAPPLLASAKDAGVLADAAQFVCRQLVLVDLRGSHHLKWRVGRAVSVLDGLRRVPVESWAVAHAGDIIARAFELHDSLVSTALAPVPLSQLQTHADIEMTDAQPQPAVSLSSIESNASKTTETETETREGPDKDKDRTLEDANTSHTMLIDHEPHAKSTQPSAQPIRATAQSSKIEIAATQSSLPSSSLEAPLLLLLPPTASSQEVNSSPSTSNQPLTKQGLGSQDNALGSLPGDHLMQNLTTFVDALSKDNNDAKFQEALRHANDVISFLKKNQEVLQGICDTKDLITSLCESLKKKTISDNNTKRQINRLRKFVDDSIHQVQSETSNVQAQLNTFNSDTKLLLEYIDRRVNLIHDKTTAYDGRFSLVTLMEEGMAQLQQNMVDLKEYSDRRLENKLSKHVESLEKFNTDLAKIATVTLNTKKESGIYKTALNKKLDHSLSLQNKLQRQLDVTVDQLDVKSLKRRLEKLEEQNDDLMFRLSSNPNGNSGTTSSTSIDELKLKLDLLSEENKLLKSKVETSHAKERSLETELQEQRKMTQWMTQEIDKMKEFQGSVFERFACLDRRSQVSLGPIASSRPLAQSTQNLSQLETPQKTGLNTTPKTDVHNLVQNTDILSDADDGNASFLDLSVTRAPQLQSLRSPHTHVQAEVQKETTTHTQPQKSIDRPLTHQTEKPVPSINPSHSSGRQAIAIPQRQPSLSPSTEHMTELERYRGGRLERKSALSKSSIARKVQNEEYKKTLEVSSGIKDLLRKGVASGSPSNKSSDCHSSKKTPSGENKRPAPSMNGFNVDVKKIKLMQVLKKP